MWTWKFTKYVCSFKFHCCVFLRPVYTVCKWCAQDEVWDFCWIQVCDSVMTIFDPKVQSFIDSLILRGHIVGSTSSFYTSHNASTVFYSVWFKHPLHVYVLCIRRRVVCIELLGPCCIILMCLIFAIHVFPCANEVAQSPNIGLLFPVPNTFSLI